MQTTYQAPRRFAVALLALAFASHSVRVAQADTLLSGFNGNLSTSLGVDWQVVGPNWQTDFSPQLSEGTGALRVQHNAGWQAGLKLAGGEQLAQLVASSDTLEFDAVGAFGMAWREVCVVMNANNETVNWQQTPQFGLGVPNEATPFTHIVIDLADVNGAATGGANWKTLAQAWLNTPAGPAKTYFELLFSFQGDTNAATADFNFDTFVDGQDFLIWQRNVGNMEAGPEQGDTNFDFLVDGVDLNQWRFEYARAIRSTIDNVVFGTNAAVAIPEPATLVSGIVASMFAMAARRRQRS